MWQIRYREYGSLKWCYTKDFKNYYRGYIECVEEKNLLIFEKEFYEKMYEVQKREGIGGV
jgi:hypothetical protein